MIVSNTFDELDNKFHCLCKQFLDKSLYVMYTNFQNAIIKKKSSILTLAKLNLELNKEIYQNKYFFCDTCTNFFISNEKKDQYSIQIMKGLDEDEEVPDEGIDPLLEIVGIDRKLRFQNKFVSEIEESTKYLIPEEDSSIPAMIYNKQMSSDF